MNQKLNDSFKCRTIIVGMGGAQHKVRERDQSIMLIIYHHKQMLLNI